MKDIYTVLATKIEQLKSVMQQESEMEEEMKLLDREVEALKIVISLAEEK